ncbi:MAG: tetratricopeptide repeat protein [Planctomycetota bacterium]
MHHQSSAARNSGALSLLLIGAIACGPRQDGAPGANSSAAVLPSTPPAPAQSAAATGPAQAMRLLEDSVTHRRQGEHGLAVKVLREAAQADPTNSLIQLALAQELLQRSPERDAIAAEVAARKSIELGYPPPDQKVKPPGHAAAVAGKRALLERSKFDEAKTVLKEFVDKTPIHDDLSAADAELRLGIIALQENDIDGALGALRQAVSLADANATSALYRTESLFMQYTLELQIDSKFQTALALTEKDQLAEAERLLKAVIAIKPDHEQAHFRLARLYQKMNRADDAAREQEIHDLLNQTQDNSSLRAQHDVDDQKRIYDRLKEIYPEYWKAYTRLARSYQQNGRNDEAIAECEQLLKAAPDVPETRMVRAEAHFVTFRAFAAKKEYKNALEHLDQAAVLAPGFSKEREKFKHEIEQAMKQVK